jgi:hypothetical protein
MSNMNKSVVLDLNSNNEKRIEELWPRGKSRKVYAVVWLEG